MMGGGAGVVGVKGLFWPPVRSRNRWLQSCWGWGLFQRSRSAFFFICDMMPPTIQMTTTMAPKMNLIEESELSARRWSKVVNIVKFCRPYGAFFSRRVFPRAYARGYTPSPLAGLWCGEPHPMCDATPFRRQVCRWLH